MMPIFQVGDLVATALAKFRIVSKQDNTYTCQVLESKTHLPSLITFTMTSDFAKYISKVV